MLVRVRCVTCVFNLQMANFAMNCNTGKYIEFDYLLPVLGQLQKLKSYIDASSTLAKAT